LETSEVYIWNSVGILCGLEGSNKV